MIDIFKKIILWISAFCIFAFIVSNLFDGGCGNVAGGSGSLVEADSLKCKFITLLNRVYNTFTFTILTCYVIWYYLFGKKEN